MKCLSPYRDFHMLAATSPHPACGESEEMRTEDSDDDNDNDSGNMICPTIMMKTDVD